MREREVRGELFFQRYGIELHVFSVMSKAEHVGHGTQLLQAFLLHSWNEGFRIVRLAAGGEKSSNLEPLRDKALRGRIELPYFRVVEGAYGRKGPGWLTLVDQ